MVSEKSCVTPIARLLTNKQSRQFMKTISKQPTCPSNDYSVTDINSGAQVFYNL